MSDTPKRSRIVIHCDRREKTRFVKAANKYGARLESWLLMAGREKAERDGVKELKSG